MIPAHARAALVGLVLAAACRRPAPLSAEGPQTDSSGCRMDGHGNRLAPDGLAQAVRCLDVPAVRRFVTAASVDVRDADGLTPLQAVVQAHGTFAHSDNDGPIAEIVALLLSHGADPNLRFTYGEAQGYTVLHHVAYDGKLRLVRMLVEAGADVNARDERGYTPLHAAAKCDFRLSYDAWAAETIGYLLARGADPTIRGRDGIAPIDRVPTDCAVRPCDAEALGRPWPSGACKQTYLVLQRALAR